MEIIPEIVIVLGRKLETKIAALLDEGD